MAVHTIDDRIADAHPDLHAAISSNAFEVSARILEIIAHIDGENDGPNWHWLALLENGRVAYITGGCDYTGWDCQSHLDVFEEETIENALRQVGEAEREQLRSQLS